MERVGDRGIHSPPILLVTEISKQTLGSGRGSAQIPRSGHSLHCFSTSGNRQSQVHVVLTLFVTFPVL